MTADNAKHFMTFGVIVVEVVDPVTPLRWPAIGPERFLEQRRRIAAIDGNCLGVDEHRQARVIGHPVVGFEQQGLRGGG